MNAQIGMDRLATPHEVVAIAYDGLCTFEFGIVVEAFALPRPEFDFPWYRFRVAAAERPIRAMGGFSLQVDAGLEILQEAGEGPTGPASFVVVDPDGNPVLFDQHR